MKKCDLKPWKGVVYEERRPKTVKNIHLKAGKGNDNEQKICFK